MTRQRRVRKTGGRHTLRASEVIEDSRTQRDRQRGQAKMRAIRDELLEIEQDTGEGTRGLALYT